MILTLKKAIQWIRSGDVVAIPTETVYGLAADAFHPGAVKKTFSLKGRPPENPLIVHISSLQQLSDLAESIPEEAYQLADSFWPGPLTLVLNKKPVVPDIVTAGLPTVAIRMPNHPLTLELIEQTGPLTAPSANRSGSPSPTRASHILGDYGKKVAVLDGGSCEIGLESTVLDLTGTKPVILRPGFITAGMIREKTGIEVSGHAENGLQQHKSPGTRYTHYKPKATVCWLDKNPGRFSKQAYYLLHTKKTTGTGPNIHSYKGNFTAFARDLYDHFRTADHLSYSQIFVETLPEETIHPLIFALKDRIKRAIGE